MLGMDRPPVATTSDSATSTPCEVATRNPPPGSAATDSTEHDTSTRTPASAHSASSMATICLDESSQNSWPSSFSCQAMPCASTSAMKCSGRKRASADLQKCGLADRKFAGVVPVLVKLQRPPPDIRIFLPQRLACSTTRTRRPRRPAVSAQNRPAAPPPITSTSVVGSAPVMARVSGGAGATAWSA
jgi:hypothetical protein